MNDNSIIRSAGYTLLEFLLAASIGSFLAVLAILLYAQCLRFYCEISQKSEQLENDRYASFFIRNELKKAARVNGVMRLEDIKKINPKKNTDVFATYAKGEGSEAIIFYITSIHSLLPHEKNVYALFMKEGEKPRIEIARGINDMNIVYGIKCEGSHNICRYVSSAEVADWKNVGSIQVHLSSQVNNVARGWSMYIAIENKI